MKEPLHLEVTLHLLLAENLPIIEANELSFLKLAKLEPLSRLINNSHAQFGAD